MFESSRRWSIAVLVVLAGGCGGAGAGVEAGPRPSGGPAAEVEAIFRARADSARTRFTEADVRFVRGMIDHHGQALVMAEFAPSHGASASVRTLAARIDNGQRDEIATMLLWLRDRGQSVPEAPTESHAMHGHDPASPMPGMLTEEQLRELEQARGPEFDRLFLTYMIRHHRGAVRMVEELFRTDGAGQDEEVFKLASDVQADQVTEIARMERMLAELHSGGRFR